MNSTPLSAPQPGQTKLALNSTIRKIRRVLYKIAVGPVIAVLWILWKVARGLAWMNKQYHQLATSAIQFIADQYDKRFVQPPRELLSPKQIIERTNKRNERDSIKTLPARRARRLTIGSIAEKKREECAPEKRPKKNRWRRHQPSAPLVSIEQSTINQVGFCDFYKLPYEIREVIWQYAIGDHHIHIVRRKGRLGNIYCPSTDPLDIDRRDICCEPRDKKGMYRATAWPMRIQPMSLIGSCRQIYSESIDHLYALNTFSFDDPEVFNLFYASLLPHRRNRIRSIHFLIDNLAWGPTDRTFNTTYMPKEKDSMPWRNTTQIISELPHIQTLTIQASVSWMRSKIPIRVILDALDDVPRYFTREMCQISIVRPRKSPHALHLTRFRIDRSFHLPPGFALEVQRKRPHDRCELLGFFMPFSVECLHCESRTVIRKATKGMAEAALTRVVSSPRRNGAALPDPAFTRYWTFHPHCNGWMELWYDWVTKEWSVTQGARRISEEEAEARLVEDGGARGPVESAHEMLQSFHVRGDPTFVTSTGESGKTIDIPTKEAFYRHVGWTKD